jgi:hypothetical protein
VVSSSTADGFFKRTMKNDVRLVDNFCMRNVIIRFLKFASHVTCVH